MTDTFSNRFLRLLWLAVCGATAGLAQRTTATIYGTLADPSGASVPNGEVRLVNTATGVRLTATSGTIGEFVFTFVPVGEYQLEVEAKGFKVYRQSGLDLSAGQQLRLTLMLELGAATEAVTVTADAPLIENATAAQQDRFSRLQLTELPQGRRDFAQLLGLQNGYRPSRDGLIQFNGLASGGNSITVDGVDGSSDSETPSTSMFQGFNFISVVSQEAIQEVSVSRGAMSAEIARTFSTNINVITRGGSNEFHGSLFNLWQNDILNARNPFLAPQERRPPVRFNQFGGSLGGPVRKDRLFFFMTYEGYRMSNQAIQAGLVPTAEFRAAAIRAVPEYRDVLALFPAATEPAVAGASVALFRGQRPTTAKDNHWVGRGDWRVNDRNSLTVRYIRSSPDRVDPRYMENPRVYRGVTNAVNANFIHGAPSWTSETRFGHNRNNTDRVDQIHAQGRIPAVEVQGLFDTQGEALVINGSSTSIENVISKTLGRHTMKAGGIFVFRFPGRYNEEVPIFRFGGAADFLANRANRVTFTFGQPRYFGRMWELGGFFQDDFKVNQRLILNLGVRYEYFSVFQERDGRLYNPDGVGGSMARPVRFRPSNSIYNADRNNLMPRVGFAYSVDPKQKTVLRGGFGMFVAPPNLRALSGLVYADPNVPTRYRFQGNDIPRLNLLYPRSNEQMLRVISVLDVPRGYNVVDPNNRDPYSLQWSFDIQRELGRNWGFQTGYVGNKGLKIVGSHNFNLPDRVTGLQPFPQSLQIGWRNQSDFSYYHAWQSSLRKRMASGINFNIHYTWGRVMAIHAGDFWPGNDIRVQDEENWRADLGPARFDVAHRVVGDFVWEPSLDRWAQASGFWKHAAGGWQVSGTFNAQSGEALNIEQRSNLDFSRPDYIGGNVYATGDRFQFINRDAFVQVPISRASGLPLRPGNVGKNSMRGPGSWGLNVGLAKNFRWAERYRLQLRLDAFGATNSPIRSAPVADITRPNFGRILGVGGTRSAQLQGRFQF